MSEQQTEATLFQRRLLWGVLVAVMLAIAFTAVMAPRWARPIVGDPPMVLGQAPGFSLINRDGRTVTNSDLLGSPWVADFIFTRCAIQLPADDIADDSAGEALAGGVEHGTSVVQCGPEVRHAGGVADLCRIMGYRRSAVVLLDRRKRSHAVHRGGGVQAGAGDESTTRVGKSQEPILHSTRFVLVDAAGTIRGYYDIVRGEELERLARDLRALRAES